MIFEVGLVPLMLGFFFFLYLFSISSFTGIGQESIKKFCKKMLDPFGCIIS